MGCVTLGSHNQSLEIQPAVTSKRPDLDDGVNGRRNNLIDSKDYTDTTPITYGDRLPRSTYTEHSSYRAGRFNDVVINSVTTPRLAARDREITGPIGA